MKKNIIGHMSSPSETVGKRIKRLNLLPKLLCLLFSLLMWLMVVDITEPKMYERHSAHQNTEVAE
ncbi:MAG: hypothetical protein IJZ80_01545 [Clostridia bacterium]|nr:hypothetical protein [Clostridia bacterium]